MTACENDTARLGAARILVIEDDEDLREALELSLELAGHEVCSARHGKEALELLRSGAFAPDLILLDMMMPVMDGWEFREAQLADPVLSLIPVCVVSASGPHGDIRGVRRVFSKPIRLQQLLDLVDECLAKRGPT